MLYSLGISKYKVVFQDVKLVLNYCALFSVKTVSCKSITSWVLYQGPAILKYSPQMESVLLLDFIVGEQWSVWDLLVTVPGKTFANKLLPRTGAFEVSFHLFNLDPNCQLSLLTKQTSHIIIVLMEPSVDPMSSEVLGFSASLKNHQSFFFPPLKKFSLFSSLSYALQLLTWNFT